MSYNTLNYGEDATADDSREDDFRLIINDIAPDILVVQEIHGEDGFNTFLSDVMNYGYPNRYSDSWILQGNSNISIGIYYKPDVFSVLSSQLVDITSLYGRRDAFEVKLKHTDSNISFYIYGIHLKASTGSTNEDERAAETAALRSHCNDLPSETHFIIAGDFNLYTSSEDAWSNLTGSEADNEGRVSDPINQVGSWHDNSNYEAYHTQNTRYSLGGMDDRFDFMLISDAMSTANNLDYISDSYTTYGNDGNHLNSSVNYGTNNAVSSDIADALYDASDHLPVHATFRFTSSEGGGVNVWINELHYDNDGTDTGEFVEIALENAGNYTLSDFTLTLYNGNGGTFYDTHALNTFTQGTTENGITLFNKAIAGLQNGAPDGMALDHDGTLVQFLSYEGTFAASGGAADGVTSTDIGVSETSSTGIGHSLGLEGSGTKYSDFSWAVFSDDTPGTPNSDGANDQSLPVELSTWTATSTKGLVILSWTTESEVENQGFIIERRNSKYETGNWQKIAGFDTDPTLEGQGSVTRQSNYTYKDNQVEVGQTYVYQLSDVDYQGKVTKHGEISVTVKAAEQNLKPTDLILHAAYPNPFNPTATISFTITGETLRATSLRVFDVNGRFVVSLYDGITEPGTYTVKWDGSNFASGIYFIRLSSGNDIQIQRVTLLR